MKKYLTHAFFASLLFSTSSLSAMETPGQEKDFAHGIKKLDDNLYIGQKEPGLYFVMERINAPAPSTTADPYRIMTCPRHRFWTSYANSELNTYHNKYYNDCVENLIPKGKGFLTFTERGQTLTAGCAAFQAAVDNFDFSYELWIAYTSARAIKNADEITRDDIEIAVTISTDKDSPMITATGIGKSFYFLHKAVKAEQKRQQVRDMLDLGIIAEEEYNKPMLKIPSENAFKLHRDLSTPLLSFGAKVQRLRDPNKIYLINSPVPIVRKWMCEKFPHDAYVDDTWKITCVGGFLLYEISQSNKAIKEREELLEMSERSKETDAELLKLKAEAGKLQIKLSELEEGYKNLPINHNVDNVEITPNKSPIKTVLNKIQIFDKERKNIIFEHDKKAGIILVNGQKLTGQETNRYKWFYHKYKKMNPEVTTNLDALSSYVTLMDWIK